MVHTVGGVSRGGEHGAIAPRIWACLQVAPTFHILGL